MYLKRLFKICHFLLPKKIISRKFWFSESGTKITVSYGEKIKILDVIKYLNLDKSVQKILHLHKLNQEHISFQIMNPN